MFNFNIITMNFKSNPCNRTEKVMTFEVDLRVEQQVRLCEISKFISFHKDILGSEPLFANIIYLDNGKVRRMNLGCYLSETDTMLVVKLIFPVEKYVNLIDDQYTEIKGNVLEYQMDKFTEVVTEKCSLLPASEQQDLFILNIDLSLSLDGNLNTAELKESILNQIRGIEDWHKPIFVRILDGYTDYYYVVESCIGPDPQKNLIIYLMDEELKNYIGGQKLIIKYGRNRNGDLKIELIAQEVFDDRIIFLNENGDGFITVNDQVSLDKETVSCWERLYKALKRNLLPVLYFKGKGMSEYHPAYYNFLPSGDGFIGKIGCTYTEIVNGEEYLTVKEFIFDDVTLGSSLFMGYQSYYAEVVRRIKFQIV